MRASTLLLASIIIVSATASFAADRSKAEKALKEAVAAENAEGVQTACDELIDDGRVTVNDSVAVLGQRFRRECVAGVTSVAQHVRIIDLP